MLTFSVILLGGVSGFAALMCMGAHNRVQSLESRCNRANADIDVQLKHRHQLIPNLFELLKGYLAHEMKQLEVVTQLQRDALSAASAQQRIQAEEMLGNSIKQIMLSANQIPQLHANAHFVSLRNELTDVDNKISAARRFYNLAVDEYNASLTSFPYSIMPTTRSKTPRAFYELGLDRPMIEEAPAIKF
jgi:LemA protein